MSEVIKEMAQTRSLGTNVFTTKDSGAADDGAAAGKSSRPNFKGRQYSHIGFFPKTSLTLTEQVINRLLILISALFVSSLLEQNSYCAKLFRIFTCSISRHNSADLDRGGQLIDVGAASAETHHGEVSNHVYYL